MPFWAPSPKNSLDVMSKHPLALLERMKYGDLEPYCRRIMGWLGRPVDEETWPDAYVHTAHE